MKKHRVKIQTAEEAKPATSAQPAHPERWVDEYGDDLFRFASARLHDPIKAEDMVQETFLAALKNVATFSGRSAEKSWLIGILRNKICDYYRKAHRETSFTDLNFYAQEENEAFQPSGWSQGTWRPELAPTEWTLTPDELLSQEEFWRTFHQCADQLPDAVSRVFLLREMDGLSGRDICELLHLTENNLWVMLHRARMALRHCLELHWFNPPEKENHPSS